MCKIVLRPIYHHFMSNWSDFQLTERTNNSNWFHEFTALNACKPIAAIGSKVNSLVYTQINEFVFCGCLFINRIQMQFIELVYLLHAKLKWKVSIRGLRDGSFCFEAMKFYFQFFSKNRNTRNSANLRHSVDADFFQWLCRNKSESITKLK